MTVPFAREKGTCDVLRGIESPGRARAYYRYEKHKFVLHELGVVMELGSQRRRCIDFASVLGVAGPLHQREQAAVGVGDAAAVMDVHGEPSENRCIGMVSHAYFDAGDRVFPRHGLFWAQMPPSSHLQCTRPHHHAILHSDRGSASRDRGSSAVYYVFFGTFPMPPPPRSSLPGM